MKSFRGARSFGVFSVLLFLAAASVRADADWLDREGPTAVRKLLANISPQGTRPGVVVASPQRKNPDYFFHWIRDSALVMDVIAKVHGRTEAMTPEKLQLRKLLLDFTDFSRQNQLAPALTGLGEPKFNVDGSAFTGPWARPQNDGPALRAI